MKGLDKETAKPQGKVDDKQLVSMMGMAMLDKGGLQTIQQALQSSQDPGQVVGQFIAQMAGQLAESTQANFGIDPAVFAAPDGFVDQMLQYIETSLGLPPEFSDQVYGETMEVLKAAAQGEQQGATAPQATAPPAQPGLDAGGVA